MYATYLALLLDIVKLEKWFFQSGESGDVTVLLEPARAKAVPKGVRSFFLPEHRAQSTILISQREGGRHLGLNVERA